MIEALLTGILSAALFYVIKRLDMLDERLDSVEKHLVKLESLIPKRKTDNLQSSIYLENSGIEA